MKWDCPVTLDQGPERECFPAETMVRVADGSQRAIEDVKTLEEVVTAEGRTGRVLQTMARPADKLVSVRLRGHAAVRCTPAHLFLTQRGYVAAAELTTEDRVAVTRWLPNGELAVDCPTEARGLRGTIAGQTNVGGIEATIAHLPSMLTRSPALGRLLGLYAAEGWVDVNRVAWGFGAHEEETLVAETIALLKTCFDAEAHVQKRPNNSRVVVIYGKTWARLFSALVPGTAKRGDKHLSATVTSGPPEFLRGAFDGWLAGDGHARRGATEGKTVSKRLALDMHAIANALGLQPSLARNEPTMNRHAKTRQPIWTMSVSDSLAHDPRGYGGHNPPQDENAQWRKVASVTDEPFDGFVFNLHVEGDESYVADGLGVHNCVGYGRRASRSVQRGTRVDPLPPNSFERVLAHWLRDASRM